MQKTKSDYNTFQINKPKTQKPTYSPLQNMQTAKAKPQTYKTKRHEPSLRISPKYFCCGIIYFVWKDIRQCFSPNIKHNLNHKNILYYIKQISWHEFFITITYLQINNAKLCCNICNICLFLFYNKNIYINIKYLNRRITACDYIYIYI